MRIDILSVLPELLESPLNHSIMKRARDKGLLEVHIHALRQWAVNKYGQVDDYQFGGGAGMVMMAEPLVAAIESLSSGGELAAAVLTDAIGRLLPGVLGDETSALFDSFQDDLLAPPVYTRPADFRGWKVPEVLLGGDPKKVEEWRHDRSLERTRERRPDLLKPDEAP
jgi:tRNA G37 N-methylase TrmD